MSSHVFIYSVHFTTQLTLKRFMTEIGDGVAYFGRDIAQPEGVKGLFSV